MKFLLDHDVYASTARFLTLAVQLVAARKYEVNTEHFKSCFCLSEGLQSGLKEKFAMSAKNRVVHRTEYPHIVRIDGICGGQAIIEGTRIAVWHIVGYYYKVGMSVEDFLSEWNYLKPAQIFSALAYYHDHKQEIDEVREQNSYERWKQDQKVYAPA